MTDREKQVAVEMRPLWHKEPCWECGDVGLATRTRPTPVSEPYLCELCEAFGKTDKEIAEMRRTLERQRQEIERLTRERDEARAEGDLAHAKLLMIGSELARDRKIDPHDRRDPRWSPTLAEAAQVRAERDEARARVAELEAQAKRTAWVRGGSCL